MHPTRLRFLAVLALPCLPLLAQTTAAKKSAREQQFRLAPATYYTPTSAGLQSFSCNIPMDWKAFLTLAGAGEVKDDNPFLAHLNTVRLGFTDDLHNGAKLDWNTTSTPSEAVDKPVAQIRDGMKQMFTGFFQTWNGFLNGTMVPLPGQSVHVTEQGEATLVHIDEPGDTVDEIYDKNMLLTQVHVVMPSMDIRLDPTFVDTPRGRLLTEIHALVKSPPTAPASDTVMRYTYATVDGFQIPATLDATILNIGHFHFNFAGCAVKTASSTSGSSPLAKLPPPE